MQIAAVTANPLGDGFFERAAAHGLAEIASTAAELDPREAAFLAHLTEARTLALSSITPERAAGVLETYGAFLDENQLADLRRVTDIAHRLSRASAIGAAITRCPDREAWPMVAQAAADYEFPGNRDFADTVQRLIHLARTRTDHDRRRRATAGQNRLLTHALPAPGRPAAIRREQLIDRYAQGRADWRGLTAPARLGLMALLDQQGLGRIPIEDEPASAVYHLANGMAIALPQRFRMIDLASQPFNRLPPAWRRHLIRIQSELWRGDLSHAFLPNSALVRYAATQLAPVLAASGLAADL